MSQFNRRIRSRIGCSVIVGMLLVSAEVTAASFAPYQVYPAAPWPSGWPEAVAVGDLNGDGRNDVVLATTSTQQGSNPDDHMLFIFLQNAAGGLNSPVKIKYSSDAEEGDQSIGFRRWTAIAVADFNGDGVDDLVAGRRFGISVVMGNKTADFSVRRVECTTGACGADSMAVMDVDQDGSLDVLAHNEVGSRFGVTVYFGDRASFTRQRLLTTRSDGGVNVRGADLNVDGHGDLVISWMQGLNNGAEVFLSDQRGWFLPGTYVPRASSLISVGALAVGDFNGDYRKDIVLGGSSFGFDGRGITLHAQTTGGGFGVPSPLPAAAPADSADIPDRAITADINGDGRDDLVVLRSGGDIGYFEQGLTGLKPEVIHDGPYATWAGSHALAAGDVNSDGCIDVVTANSNYGLVVFRARDCVVRYRVNGSQPLIRTGQAIPTHMSKPAVNDTAALPSTGAGLSTDLPSGIASAKVQRGDSARLPGWAYLLLCSTLLSWVLRRWW